MNWYKNLRLRAKLILGFIATAILTLLVGWQGMSAARTMSAGSDRLYREGVKGVRATGQITKNISDLRQRLRDLMILTTPDALRKNKQQYDDNREAIYKYYAELLEITKGSPDLTRLVSKTSGTFEDWIKTVDKAADYAMAGKIQDAVQQMSVTAVPVNKQFLNELDELAAAMDKAAENLDKYNVSVKRRTDMIVIAITLAVFAASILLGITISNMVVGTLDRISMIIQKVALGDLTAHFIAESKDELGVMAMRLEKMVNQIWDFINKVHQGVNSVADYATELSHSAEEMSSTIEQISHSADAQRGGAERMANAMAELSDSVDKVSQNAQQFLTQLQAAITTLQDNYANNAGDANDATKGAMRVIKKMSGRIAQAMSVIHEIAHQTNLVSRNAALEAAQAGEHGKGFAAAAEDVRKLARHSAASAKEIVRHNLEARDSMESSSEMVAITMELLRDIKVGIATKEQPAIGADAIRQAENSIASDSVASAASEMSVSTSEVARTASELANLAAQLQARIRQFRLDNRIG